MTSSFRRKPESSGAERAKKNWSPAFAGVTWIRHKAGQDED
jgi:hypothetical protein